MNDIIVQWLQKIPALIPYEQALTSLVAGLAVMVLAAVSYALTKRVVVRLIKKFITKTESNLDDILLRRKLFERLALLVPSIVIFKLMPTALATYPALATLAATAAAIYCVLVIALAADSLINSLIDIYHHFPISRRVPIQSFGQVAKLFTYFIALIVIASLLIGESPMNLFAGLGAMTAVLMLVFKDPILGFVAGLQLSYNKMVSLGDWVDIPQHKASGDILEIGLTTVKIQNFDNTITTVPTQALINDSFKNWRGMQESGGRRIKRSIFVDVNSIGFCDHERLAKYSKVEYIKDYIAAKQAELATHNASQAELNASLVNGRRITNIGTFRAYILAYLKNHKKINQHLTILVRQLAVADSGVPLEIYAFSADKNWANYEAVQADIFDHLFAVAGEFDLRLFQKPSGADLLAMSDAFSRS